MTPLLHADEVPVDETSVRALLRAQCPEWAELPLSAAGSGTDNTMYRLGQHLLVRLPRTPAKTAGIVKERECLPLLANRLPVEIPRPVFAGAPGATFPLVWSIYSWLDGVEVGIDTVEDWTLFGIDLARFVRALHATVLNGARREGHLTWYRGGHLEDTSAWISGTFASCREIDGLDLDLNRLEQMWLAALALPQSREPHVWLHGDLRPTNLLARDGRLSAVIDFGALSVGLPDAEHSTLWDFPEPARNAYQAALGLDDLTRLRAQAWAIVVGVSGVSYYWSTYPAFVEECLARLRAILDDPVNDGA